MALGTTWHTVPRLCRFCHPDGTHAPHLGRCLLGRIAFQQLSGDTLLSIDPCERSSRVLDTMEETLAARLEIPLACIHVADWVPGAEGRRRYFLLTAATERARVVRGPGVAPSCCTICGDDPRSLFGECLLDVDFEETCPRCHVSPVCRRCLGKPQCLLCLVEEDNGIPPTSPRSARRFASLVALYEASSEGDGDVGPAL